MLAIFAATTIGLVDAAPAKAKPRAAKRAVVKKMEEKPVVVKQTSHDPVVRSSNAIDVRIIGEGTALAVFPMNQGKVKHHNTGKASKAVFAMDETNIGLLANGKTDRFYGLNYGLKVTLTMDKYGESGTVVKDSYLTFGNNEKWGDFYIGNIKGAEYRVVNTVTPVLDGLGAFMYNDWTPFVNLASGINRTELELEGKVSRAAKVMYVSPKLHGFQFTASYTPNSRHNGFGPTLQSHTPNSMANMATVITRVDTINPAITKYHTDSWAAGLSYTKGFDNGATVNAGASVITSATKSYIVAPTATTYDVQKLSWYRRVLSYTLGVVGTYKGVELGVQWIDNGKSGEARHFSGRNAGKGIAAAIGYKFGAHKVAAGYYHFYRKLGTTPSNYGGPTNSTGAAVAGSGVGANVNLGSAKMDGLAAVYTHQVAEGLKFFGEYGVLRTRTSNEAYRLAFAHSQTTAGSAGVPSNTAHAILAGLSINF